MATESIMTAKLSITPAIAMRTISFEKVRSDLMAIRLAMKYSMFKLFAINSDLAKIRLRHFYSDKVANIM